VRISSASLVNMTVSGGVYVHWPYCAKRCTYCAFNKYVVAKPKENSLQMATANALIREAEVSEDILALFYDF